MSHNSRSEYRMVFRDIFKLSSFSLNNIIIGIWRFFSRIFLVSLSQSSSKLVSKIWVFAFFVGSFYLPNKCVEGVTKLVMLVKFALFTGLHLHQSKQWKIQNLFYFHETTVRFVNPLRSPPKMTILFVKIAHTVWLSWESFVHHKLLNIVKCFL